MTLNPAEIAAARTLVELALAEDLGPTGDRTTLALIPPETVCTATFIARKPGVIAGLPVAAMALERVDDTVKARFELHDGAQLTAGQEIGTFHGKLQSILIAERTALNFLQRLSGVATLTRQFVQAVAGTTAQILDTRKTAPGWRTLDKYAVRCGGGRNHRFGLFDAILIKDNHLAGVNGDVVEAVRRARSFPGNAGLAVEIEVTTLEQLEKVLSVQPEIVLLDNMPPEVMKNAVTIRNRLAPKSLLEASGGITLSTIRAVADTGVDRISIGALTHSAPALDIALDIPV